MKRIFQSLALVMMIAPIAIVLSACQVGDNNYNGNGGDDDIATYTVPALPESSILVSPFGVMTGNVVNRYVLSDINLDSTPWTWQYPTAYVGTVGENTHAITTTIVNSHGYDVHLTRDVIVTVSPLGQLGTPTIIQSGFSMIITNSPFPLADHPQHMFFMIYANGAPRFLLGGGATNANMSSVLGTIAGIYTVQVRAIANPDFGFIDSELSNSLVF